MVERKSKPLPKILVVEDDVAMASAICESLGNRGLSAVAADDGAAALSMVTADPEIGLILSDIKMPKMDGMDLLRAVKRLRPSIMVVMMTGFGTIQQAVEAVKSGAEDFLTKPFHLAQLDVFIQRCLHQIESDALVAKLAGTIFLSYAREDREPVTAICQQLKSQSFDPWMDIERIIPGEKWEHAIRTAISKASLFLACVSSRSVSKRGMVQKELRLAMDVLAEQLDSDVYVIPVRLEPCDVPNGLREFHWVDYFEPDGPPRLLAGIREGLLRRAWR